MPAFQPGYMRDVDGACVVAPAGYDDVDPTDAKPVDPTDFPLVTGGGFAPD